MCQTHLGSSLGSIQPPISHLPCGQLNSEFARQDYTAAAPQNAAVGCKFLDNKTFKAIYFTIHLIIVEVTSEYYLDGSREISQTQSLLFGCILYTSVWGDPITSPNPLLNHLSQVNGPR